MFLSEWKTRIIVLFAFVGCFNVFSKTSWKSDDGLKGFFFEGKLYNSTNADFWSSLLNHDVPGDQLFANKFSLDGVFGAEVPSAKAVLDLRTKGVFGNNKTLKTSSVQLKDNGGYLQPLDQSHQHTVNLPVTWFREVWVEVDLAKSLSMDRVPLQTLTIGSFPFALGRGIALGTAYGFNPGTLGFYMDGTVDQYAYGVKFSGGFSPSIDLTYDLYASVLQNNGTSISETLSQTQAQATNENISPLGGSASRGAGKVNWILAGRLNILPVKTDSTQVRIEPYALYNNAPEQTVEFYGDASSKLGTFGLAADVIYGDWEFGFDGAKNVGSQQVKGWDRNVINQINSGGVYTYIYTDVTTVDPSINVITDTKKAVYDAQNSAAKRAVNGVLKSSSSNGDAIAGTTWYNSLTRFRAPYSNKYQGYMFVADFGYWLYKRDLKIAGTAGIASGDLNPNANLLDPLASKVDGNYKGFIGLQEIYSGKLVKSVFVMGGSKKLVRPLTAPKSGDLFSSVVDTFSNLVFVGSSLNYAPRDSEYKIVINPNLLTYWEQVPGRKFDLATFLTIEQEASKFLGVEANIIGKGNISENIILDIMVAIFQPGAHYHDIQGQPFTPAQRKILDSTDPTAIPDYLPVLWNDTSYSFSTGLAYVF